MRAGGKKGRFHDENCAGLVADKGNGAGGRNDKGFPDGGRGQGNGHKLIEEEMAYLEEMYVPHAPVGVIAQNTRAAARQSHVVYRQPENPREGVKRMDRIKQTKKTTGHGLRDNALPATRTARNLTRLHSGFCAGMYYRTAR